MVDANANISGAAEPIVLDPDLVDAVRSEIYLWLNEDSPDRDLARKIISIVRAYDDEQHSFEQPLTDLDRHTITEWQLRGISRVEHTPEFIEHFRDRLDKILQGLNDRIPSKRRIARGKTQNRDTIDQG